MHLNTSKEGKKMLLTMLSMCQNYFLFVCFPGRTGIPKIKDLKDVLGDVRY